MHKFGKILGLHRFSRISQNLAKSIVEVEKVSVKIHFVNAFLDIFNKRLVPFTGNPVTGNQKVIFQNIRAIFSFSGIFHEALISRIARCHFFTF
jgi:hypothetical protein